jgi:two-component system, NtrC family, sensor kinase
LDQTETRIAKLIEALSAIEQGRFELISPASENDSLSQLESVVRHLQVNLRSAGAESGSAIAGLVTANIHLSLSSEVLQKVNRADSILYQGGDLRDFYRQVVAEARLMVRARYGLLVIFDAEGRPVEFVSEGMSEEAIAKIGRLPEGKGLLRTLYHAQAPLKLDQVVGDPRFQGFPPGHPVMKTLLGAPLQVAGKTKGVLYFADKEFGEFFDSGEERIPDNFSESDLAMLGLFSEYLARSMERIELMAALQEKSNLLQKEKSEQEALVKRLNEAQNQLLQSEKLASIGQLAAGVAHEINNPIGYINSNLGSLERYVSDLLTMLAVYESAEGQFAPGSECIAQIQQLKKKLDMDFLREDVATLMKESLDGVARVRKIVQDLKDFSHVDESEWQWFDLHKGLDNTLNMVRNEIKYKAEVIKEYGVLPKVECLPFQLGQVFMNMLVNAAQAIDEHGTITLRTGVECEEVWLEFLDTGHGIPPENLARIFDPFFTTKPVGKGTGLGLSVSYSIVEKHHGRISVTSEVGKGTTFRVTLPVRQPKPAPQ